MQLEIPVCSSVSLCKQLVKIQKVVVGESVMLFTKIMVKILY